MIRILLLVIVACLLTSCCKITNTPQAYIDCQTGGGDWVYPGVSAWCVGNIPFPTSFYARDVEVIPIGNCSVEEAKQLYKPSQK